MHRVNFSNSNISKNLWTLEGEYFSGKVELVHEGIWRILLYHRLEDEQKQSWVLENIKKLDFNITQQGNQYKLCANEQELEISLAPLKWTFAGIKFPGVEAHRLHQFGGVDDMVHLATGVGNPIAETMNGCLLGSGMTLILEEEEDRHYYGLGERTGFLNKKGRIWRNWTTDNSKHTPDTDPLYQSHPFVMGCDKQGHAFGIYIDETWQTSFDLASTDPKYSFIRTDGPTLDIYLISGPKPKDVLLRYTSILGRSPLPPLWALGYHQCRWSYPNDKTILSVAKEYRKRNIPLDVMWLDIDYMEGYKVFTFSPYRFPKPKELTQKLKEQGIRTVTIVDPGVKKEAGYYVYEQGSKSDYWVKNRRDEPLVGKVWPDPAVWPDFTREEVREWWGDLHKFYLVAGVDGIWNDMNEPASFSNKEKTLPPGAKHGAHWHAEVHNLYGYTMCQATYGGLKKLSQQKRPFVLTRSGFAGIHKYAWIWTGDNSSYWEHLETSMPMILNMGISAMPFVGADIGGFSKNGDGELLTRWTWLGAFYPFMRNHSGKTSSRQEPWSFGEPYCGYIAKAIRFRYQLLPYLYTLTYQACQDGLPLMRALFLEYPDDPETLALYDQFLMGTDLLVAPVIRPGQTHRLVYLPQGEWQCFWSGKYYQGKSFHAIATQLDTIPLFIKKGAAIPLAPVALNTDSAMWSEVTWRLAVDEKTSAKLYADAGDGYQKGEICTLQGNYDGKKLTLARSDADNQRKHKVEILNCDKPQKANGEYSFKDGCLLVEFIEKELEIVW